MFLLFLQSLHWFLLHLQSGCYLFFHSGLKQFSAPSRLRWTGTLTAALAFTLFVCFYINKLSLHCDSKAGVSNIRPKMCDKIGLAQTPVWSNYYRTVWAMLYTFCFTHHTDLGNRFLSFSRVTLLSYAAKLRHTVETALFLILRYFSN